PISAFRIWKCLRREEIEVSNFCEWIMVAPEDRLPKGAIAELKVPAGCRLVVPNPRIVNMSSILGSQALHADAKSPIYDFKSLSYDASKAALNSFTIYRAEAVPVAMATYRS